MDKPFLAHLTAHLAGCGLRRFVFCAGFMGEAVARFAESLHGFLSIGSLSCSETSVFQGKSNNFPDMGIIVRDEDESGFIHCC